MRSSFELGSYFLNGESHPKSQPRPRWACTLSLLFVVKHVLKAFSYRLEERKGTSALALKSQSMAALLVQRENVHHSLSLIKKYINYLVLNIVILVFLIGIYSIGCCAFQNTKRAETDYPYGQNRMSKVKLRWDYYWSVTHPSRMLCYLDL
jgi:hypothetical protein